MKEIYIEKLTLIEEKLREKGETIATMESCTGGSLASQITNIKGASSILKFSAVTYSNEYKIKMGVSENIIDKYSVYSMEVAKEMSYSISSFANASYGIGVTGKMLCSDKQNPYGDDNQVFYSIYQKEDNIYYTGSLKVKKLKREENKLEIIESIINKLEKIICD